MFCKICGRSYTAEVHPTKNKAYYRCAAFRGHSNRNQNIEVSTLEKAVEEQFKTIQFERDFLDMVMEVLKNLRAGQRGTLQSHKQALQNQQKAIEAKRDLAEEKLFSGVLADADFLRLKNKFNQDLAQIYGQLAQLENQGDMDIEVVCQALRLTRNARKEYQKAPMELKRRYLQSKQAYIWRKIRVVSSKTPPLAI